VKSRYPRVVIGGLRGGSGKTTLSLGIVAAWRKRGLVVAPFKKGPDYIDAGWLSAAAGRPCYNLDPFLIGRDRTLASFAGHFREADVAVVEGNRGIYDGMDSAGTFSTAELSKALRSPVVIVLDCTKATRTAGAMVLGMQKFDKRVDIKGVVLNQIAGARHEKIVRESIEGTCSIPVVGSLPKLSGEFLSERHMGLTPFQEHPEVEKAIATCAEAAEKYLDLSALLEIAKAARALPVKEVSGEEGQGAGLGPAQAERSVTVGIIRDSAFQFYYPENFEELAGRGARLVEISALTEKKLPAIDALYIGGGFPETNAIALARNASFRKSVRTAVEAGLPVYAECGGLMYLGKSLVMGGKTYPMAGVFPISFSLEEKPQAHGYTIVEVARRNPFYPKGLVVKGHEFHYSKVIEFQKKKGMGLAFAMKRGQGIAGKMDGLIYKNVLATYTHLHAYGVQEWADGLVERAERYKETRS
jgi:cobyrinic acid a,c-diamide synthase